MLGLLRRVRRLCPPRVLAVSVFLMVFFLPSCAAGEEVVATMSRSDAGVQVHDVVSHQHEDAPLVSTATSADATSSLNLVTRSVFDAGLPLDSLVSSSSMPDVLVSWSDSSDSVSTGDSAATLDVSLPTPPDVPVLDREAPDVSVSDVATSDVATSDAPRPILDAVASVPDSSVTFDVHASPVDVVTAVVDATATVVDVSRDAGYDLGRADGCHEIIVRLQGARLPTCMLGWVAILYDSDGHPHESTPGSALTFILCGRLRGVLILSARCGGDYLLDWPGAAGQPVNQGGVASIMLDGNELADAEALFCLDHFSPTPGVRPAIPLETFFYGRCP